MKNINAFIKNQISESLRLSQTEIDEMTEYAREQIEEIISENDLDIEIIELYAHGSRVFGNPRQDSDFDIVLYYKGNMKEDSLFNILHDDEYADMFIYNDIVIDINPIRDQETGSLKKYIEKDKNYHK